MSKADYALHATLIGSFSVTLNERVVCNSNVIPHRIMARLLLDPAGCSYRQLGQEIYDEDEDELAPDARKRQRDNTRKAVQHLREQLGAASKHLLPDASKSGDVLKLELEGVDFSTDVKHFEELVTRCVKEPIEAYREILAKYKGRLLPDFPPQIWLDIRRDELEAKRDQSEQRCQKALFQHIDHLLQNRDIQRDMDARRQLREWLTLLVEIPTFQKSPQFDVVNGNLLKFSQAEEEHVCQSLKDLAGALDAASQSRLGYSEPPPALDDCSDSLITTREATLLSRCSIFKRAWSLQAAQSVCQIDGLDASEVTEALCRKQALRITTQANHTLYYFSSAADQSRWRENLQRQSKSGETQALYFAYICGLTEQAILKFDGAEQVAWFNRLEAEHQNIEFSLEWVYKEQDKAGQALRLAECLWRYWDVRGYRTQGRRHLRYILAMPENQQVSLARAAALNGAALLAMLQEDHVEASQFLQEALKIALEKLEHDGDPHEVARVQDAVGGIYNSLGFLAWCQDIRDWPGSRSNYRKARYWFRKAGNEAASLWPLRGLADYCKYKAQMQRAKVLYEASRRVGQATNNTRGLAFVLTDLARVAEMDRDWQKARKLFMEAMTLANAIQDRGLFAVSLEALTRIAMAQKRYARAAILLAAAEHLRQDVSLYQWEEEQEANRATKIMLQQELGDAYEAQVERGRTLAADQANIVQFVITKENT